MLIFLSIIIKHEIKKNRKVFVESALIFRNKTDYMKKRRMASFVSVRSFRICIIL